MNKIPLHKLAEKFNGKIAALRYISEEEAHRIDYAHRDDYYIFFLVEKGNGKFLIDFEEHEIKANSIYYIVPGQVHFPTDRVKASAWILAVDAMFIRKEYKEVLDKISIRERNIQLKREEMKELSYYISAIHKRIQNKTQPIGNTILDDLFSLYIGMIAEIYQRGFSESINSRVATITSQFKLLLSNNYQTLKRPSQYASLLNISPVYLNEAIKKTTGLNVSECIQNEIVLQAKRLLYYTDLSIKEIALELGYEDYAYFTRLFSKSALSSPTQFRKKYLK